MVGEEHRSSEDRAGAAKGHAAPPPSLADQTTFPVSDLDQETPASRVAPFSDPPASIDHFEIRRLLGNGGFGSVFLAHDVKLERMVALKLLDKLDRHAARRMLDDETRAASKLRHPNLVTVFQSGENARGYYIVFEHIPGPDRQRATTLREVLKEKHRLPADEAVALVRQVAEALVHAHETGVVHRDIKPENILLDYKGSAFLADFGCARRSRRHTEGVRSFVGTLPYMSLEQMEGCWNAQTDLWSLGVMLYEVLSGARPFAFAEKTRSRSAAEATFSFAAAIVGLERLPPIPGVDRDLNAICRKCLQREPGERYATAAELVEDLARWQRNEPVSCRRAGWVEQVRRWAQRNSTVATLLSATLLILALGFGVSTYFAAQMWTARQRYVDQQLAQLDQLDSPTFAAVLTNLRQEPFQRIASRSLATEWHDLEDTPRRAELKDRLAVAIVMLQRAETKWPLPDALVAAAQERIYSSLLTAKTPDEFQLLRASALQVGTPSTTDDAGMIAALWKAAAHDTNPPTQFRALCALATYDPVNEAWNELASQLARRLLDQETELIARWTSSITPLSDRLLPILKSQMDSVEEPRKTRAAIAYATLASTPLELAKRIDDETSPGVVRELLLQIRARLTSPQQAGELLSQWELPMADPTPRQLANRSVSELALLGSESIDRLPIFSPNADFQARCLFERDIAAYGLSPASLLAWITRLEAEGSNPDFLRTAVLAMGASRFEQLSTQDREPILDAVTALYQDHASARVHSAAERVLREWQIELPRIESRREAIGEDSWRVNQLGQCLIRVTLSDGRQAEVASHEITLGDYVAYARSRATRYGPEEPALSWIREPIKRHLLETSTLPDESTRAVAELPEEALSASQLQLPVRHISALQAVAYCVWASLQDGIPEDQLAFRLRANLQGEDTTVLDAMESQLGQSASPLDDCDQQASGYRLPFSDEWEFLFDEPSLLDVAADDLQDQLGWYRGNSQLEIHPVAAKRPHRLGVFDAWGNVTEWCLLGSRETHVPFESLGSSYESALGAMRPIRPGIEVFGGHRTIGFRMIRRLD